MNGPSFDLDDAIVSSCLENLAVETRWPEDATDKKGSHDDPLASDPQGESLDVFEFLARVLTQIPKPRQHGVHDMGAYSSRARAFRKRKNRPLQSLPSAGPRIFPTRMGLCSPSESW